MQSAHGVGYELYMQNLNIRIRVEQRREKEYLLSRRMIADLDRRIHK